jgi:RNA polymerase sigma-70 factor (ECF subfamily)
MRMELPRVTIPGLVQQLETGSKSFSFWTQLTRILSFVRSVLWTSINSINLKLVSERSDHIAATSPSDDLLLEGVRNRNQQSMANVFDRYGGMVYSVALRVLKDKEQAEDVMQDIFFQLWSKPEAFVQGRGSLGAWLLVVARNRAIDRIRRRTATESPDDVVLPSRTNLADESERNILMEKVRAILENLPPEQQKSLQLAYFEGLSHSEISMQTGEPLGTVKTRIRLALIGLRKALAA